MVKFVKKDAPDFDKNDLNNVLVALSAEAQLPYQRQQDQSDAPSIKSGREILLKADPIRCLDCHTFGSKEGDEANTPNLTGYASRPWLIDFISNPGHQKFYGKKNEMPAFGAKKILDEKSIGMIADWLRGDWYEPGQMAISPPPATSPATTQAH
jgi:ubiquinol-cytochrome c reductase cytochrome b subunit